MRTQKLFATRGKAVLLLAVAGLAISGCEKLGIGGGDKKAPSGPVVAKLDGQEITSLEVNAELQGMAIPPSMDRREAEKMALGNILTRRMLAQVAEERKIDSKPEFFLQQQRMLEQLRVQGLAREIANSVVAPTRDDAETYMRENPNLFAERTLLLLDQIQFLRPDNIETLNLEGAKTMAEVEAILKANNIQFRRQPAPMDPLSANPTFIKEIMGVLKDSPNEVFMFASRPQGAPAPVILVNQVKDKRVEPFTGDKAREFAINQLRNQRVQNALKAEVDKVQEAQKTRVTYQPGWEISDKKDAASKDTKLVADKTEKVELPGGTDQLNPESPLDASAQ